MPTYLNVMIVVSLIGSVLIAVISLGMFFDSWAEGERNATIAGIMGFFCGLFPIITILVLAGMLAEKLKGVQ